MVWLWIFSECYLLRNFFLGIMGFKPSFLLLHPSLFEVEPQSQKQQLYPHILFPVVRNLRNPKSFFIGPKAPST